MPLRTAALALIGMIAALPAAAAEKAQPSLTSAESNVAFAVKSICAPYVLDGVEEAKLPLRRPLVAEDGYSSPSIQQLGAKAVRVGFAGYVHVGVGGPNGARRCELSAARADPQSLRKVVLETLAERPEHFAPTRSRYLPGARWDSEDTLCAAADSAHPGAFALLSVAPAAERDRIAILLTLAEAPARGAQCDHEGVRMNYRTLAP
jgi:hypothetical protein